jgi:hypothetical protein
MAVIQIPNQLNIPETELMLLNHVKTFEELVLTRGKREKCLQNKEIMTYHPCRTTDQKQ